MWSEVVPGEIWETSSYFNRESFERIIDEFDQTIGKKLAPGPEIRESFRKSSVNPTLYYYNVHPTKSFLDDELIEAIYSPLRSFFGQSVFNEKYFEKLNPLQLFFKSFSERSFYDVHTEPADLYGDYAFIVFLDDCDTGDLVFPDQNQLDEYLELNKSQKEPLSETVALLKSKGESPRLVGPYRVRPRQNHGVIFKVGSLHWVDESEEKSIFHRKCVTGWPFAKEKLIKNLDENCNIESYFSIKEEAK